jgi:hypothetical protein
MKPYVVAPSPNAISGDSGLRSFIAEAETCARTMLENAAFIDGELPSIQVPDAIREQTVATCDALSDTAHQVISDLLAVVADNAFHSTEEVSGLQARIGRTMRRLRSAILQFHRLVLTLDAAREETADYMLAVILISESGANILNAFNRTVDAVAMLSSTTVELDQWLSRCPCCLPPRSQPKYCRYKDACSLCLAL